MKDNNEMSTIDAFLGLFFILLCPVMAISIYQWDFSSPVWGYIVFAIATYRMYHLFFRDKYYSKGTVKLRKYEPGDDVETNIVGVTFENRQQIIQKIKVGQNVYLIREPENLHDKNAIKVIVDRYTNDERKKLEPELQNRYGKSSYKEIFGELYAKDNIGYINRELAEKISSIFDKYAIEPNQFINATVIGLTGTENKNFSKGLRIRFKLPTQKDLELAIQKEIQLEREMDSMMFHPPF